MQIEGLVCTDGPSSQKDAGECTGLKGQPQSGVPEGGQHTQEQQGGLAQEVEPESGGTQPENALEPLRVSLEPGQMGSMLLPRREPQRG